MNEEPKNKVSQLQIQPADRRRSTAAVKLIFIGVTIAAVIAALIWQPWREEGQRTLNLKNGGTTTTASAAAGNTAAASAVSTSNAASAAVVKSGDDSVVLTVSGYIVTRERIEVSPRFMGMVKWIGVKKGDTVTNDQVVVLLDDAEQTARLREAEGRLDGARAALAKAELDLNRINELAKTQIESRQSADDARLRVDAARASLAEARGTMDLAKTYLDWCTIRSPINGVVLEKLVDPNELVTPQSFGGTRGPSTALIAVADPKDLQVEIDMSEADLAKISLNQSCRVSPEAYLDKVYAGKVVEIAPEANRAKGTLQIKVQVLNPDKFLTPELSAKVEFLKVQ